MEVRAERIVFRRGCHGSSHANMSSQNLYGHLHMSWQKFPSINMVRSLSEEEVQVEVEEYKESVDWEEKKETVTKTSRAVRTLAESIVDHYDGLAGTNELSTLYRLCQIDDRASAQRKRQRVDDLKLPKDEKAEIKSHIDEDLGIVGGGQAQIAIPGECESETYQLLADLVSSDDLGTLDAAIDEFASLDIKGVQAGVLSPIFFFLHPSNYPVINSASKDGMGIAGGYDISSRLQDYTEEAEKYRSFRDKYELGREDGNLRDIDWFFYTIEGEQSSDPKIWIEKTKIHAPYKEPGNGELALGRAVICPQESANGSDIYSPVRKASVGDIVVHLLQDEEKIIGASVVNSELVTDYDFPEAVIQRWEPQQRKQGGYLRRLSDFTHFNEPPHPYDDLLDNPEYQDDLESIRDEHTGLFFDKNRELLEGFYFTGCPDGLASLLADTSPELSVFFEDHGYDWERWGTENESDEVYHLWNTNYENENTDGRQAFQRGVAAAYGADKYGEKLTRPAKGDYILAYLPGIGVIGAGRIIEETDGERIDKSDSSINPIKKNDTPEYHLPVDWEYTLPRENAVSVPEAADFLSRGNMSRVGTTEKPSDQDGAAELYEEVRRRFIESHESSSYTTHQHEDIRRLIEEKKQVVFYGPPGTGKTYTATRFAEWFRAKTGAISLGDDQIRNVTFHPSFAYEDFLEGFTASIEDGDQVAYDYEKGAFAEIVADAKRAYERAESKDEIPPYFLIIDEINRGNLAQIFGETITLLEADKRLDEDNVIVSRLAHSNEKFVIPPNLYVIGTMNTADESIALVDTALRRRFRFLSFPPRTAEIVNQHDAFTSKTELEAPIQKGNDATNQLLAASILAIDALNEQIIDLQHLGKGKQIGHTYLLNVKTPQEIVDTWRFEILPQLEEYYFGQFDRLKRDLFSDLETGLLDDETKEIKSFGAGLLYEALCDLSGIAEDARAPLAEYTEKGGRESQAAANSWREEKTVESFLSRLSDRVSNRGVTFAEDLIELAQESGRIDPGDGDEFATLSAKHEAVDPNVGVFVIRENGNFSFKFDWLSGRDQNDLTDDDFVPALEILHEHDPFSVTFPEDGKPNMEDVAIDDLDGEGLEVIWTATERSSSQGPRIDNEFQRERCSRDGYSR